MPDGATPLSVGKGDMGYLCLWALVDTDRPDVDRRVVARQTGHDCTVAELDVYEFVGTVEFGALEYHVWCERS
jgi:hypothetical protein